MKLYKFYMGNSFGELRKLIVNEKSTLDAINIAKNIYPSINILCSGSCGKEYECFLCLY